MPWAIFTREHNWSSPRAVFSWNTKPSPQPQERPRHVIDDAVARGFAHRVPSPSRDGKRALTETDPKRPRRPKET